MRGLTEYKIAFSGLTLGVHEYDFEVTDKFFEHFDHEELHNVNVELVVELEKKSNMLQLWFGFQGTGSVFCDRCGKEMEIELDGEEELIIKFGEGGFEEQTDDIVVIGPAEHEIDISHYVFEFIMLSVPLSHSHDIEDCDPEVIRTLEELSGKKEEEQQQEDPRWAALKKYKNDNNE
ncbi:MAG: DUF177 domain-containing protein [Bacteroidota bacterium]